MTSLPLDRQVEFRVDLVLRVTTIACAPYWLAPTEITSTKMIYCDGFKKLDCNGLLKNRYKKSHKYLESCCSNGF